MKYLLLFLISFNLNARSLSEISNMRIEDNLLWTFTRLTPGCLYTQNEKEDFYEKYELLKDQGTCVKPSLIEAQNELIIIQAELIVIENARLLEIARRADLNNRFNSLTDIRMSMHKCGYNIANSKIFIKKIIDGNIVFKLECMEGYNQEIIDEATARNVKKGQMKQLRNILRDNTRPLTNAERDKILYHFILKGL